MKKLLPIALIVLFLNLVYLRSLNPSSAFTGDLDIGKGVEVGATVGEHYIDISGFVAPFASVALLIADILIRGAVADAGGEFFLSRVNIGEGVNSICFRAVDFRRLGESFTCLDIPPVDGPVEIKDIFLPPTLGLSRTTMAAGGEVFAFGFSMPGAEVRVHIVGGEILTAIADDTGYYTLSIRGLPAGTYSLYATAVYKNRVSLEPVSRVELRALSERERVIERTEDLLRRTRDLLTSLGLGILWLVIPILILIFILIWKLWRDKFMSFTKSRWFIFLFKRRRKDEEEERQRAKRKQGMENEVWINKN